MRNNRKNVGNGNVAFSSVVVAVEPFFVFGLEHLTRRGAEWTQSISFSVRKAVVQACVIPLGFIFSWGRRVWACLSFFGFWLAWHVFFVLPMFPCFSFTQVHIAHLSLFGVHFSILLSVRQISACFFLLRLRERNSGEAMLSEESEVFCFRHFQCLLSNGPQLPVHRQVLWYLVGIQACPEATQLMGQRFIFNCFSSFVSPIPASQGLFFQARMFFFVPFAAVTGLVMCNDLDFAFQRRATVFLAAQTFCHVFTTAVPALLSQWIGQDLLSGTCWHSGWTDRMGEEKTLSVLFLRGPPKIAYTYGVSHLWGAAQNAIIRRSGAVCRAKNWREKIQKSFKIFKRQGHQKTIMTWKFSKKKFPFFLNFFFSPYGPWS